MYHYSSTYPRLSDYSLKAHQFLVSTFLILLLMLVCNIAIAHASSKPFNVTVNYQTSATQPTNTSPPSQPIQAQNSAFCRVNDEANAVGASYTVVCATGSLVSIDPIKSAQQFTPMNGSAYRYTFQANRGGNFLGSIDSFIGTGTIANWRVINLSEQDYLEMLINW